MSLADPLAITGTDLSSRLWPQVCGPLRTALRSRLLHFLLLGGGIFLLAPKAPTSRDIVLSPPYLDALRGAQRQRLGVAALSPQQGREVIDRAVEDEVLFREGVRLGLDRDDHIIRQRIIEKVLVLAEDLGGAARPPTENDLKDYFAATRGQWIEPARVTLVHIFLSPAHRDQAEALRTRAQADAGPEDDPPPLGDAFPLRRKLTATEAELQKDYGADFARVAFALEPRTWSDMVASVHGLHLIKVLQRTAQHPASYEEVRERLPMDYLLWRKHEATTSFLREAFARYRIEADGVPVTGYQPTGRVAPGRASGGD